MQPKKYFPETSMRATDSIREGMSPRGAQRQRSIRESPPRHIATQNGAFVTERLLATDLSHELSLTTTATKQ